MFRIFVWLFFGFSGIASAEPGELCGGEVVEKASGWWLNRGLPGTVEGAIGELEVARSKEPDCYVLRWQLARFHYWQAVQGGGDVLSHSENGWLEAREAIRIAPGRVEGHYWAAACAGTWAEQLSVPMALAMGMPDRFEEPAKRAVAIDPSHDGGGPLRTLGTYYARLPWPFQELEQAETLLRRAYRIKPNSAANLYYLADLADRKGDASERGQRLVELELAQGDDDARTARYRRLGRDLVREGS